ncbi:phytanoyl-CoA dioxygenase family protein [Alphaproteobacteria bacterium]|nr:phytanoyl-CoA dioxygenase family protein [Alphaproteobacteria bacterium]
MECLSEEQVGFYREKGYLVLENRVPMAIIESIRVEITRFEEEAGGMTQSNDRIDLENNHSPDHPRVRRIKLPHKTSDIVNQMMYSDHVLAPVRDLIGDNLRLHSTKLNMKSASYGAVIEWHQDFAFYPHTNDDVLAVGIAIDDMSSENGPLMVMPGSHKGPIYDHHIDSVFAGAMDLTANGLSLDDAVELSGPAGSLSIHHGRIAHGSAPNTSDRDRRLLFIEITAADAFPVSGSMTKFDGIEDYNNRMLCGEPTLTPRLTSVPVRIPQPQPDLNRSIYEIQSQVKSSAFSKGD